MTENTKPNSANNATATDAAAPAGATEPRKSELYSNNASGQLFEVSERGETTVSIHPQGGGFVYKVGLADFAAKFTPATIPPYGPALVSGDWFDGLEVAECYSDGRRWNGWGMPMFTYEQALKLIAICPTLTYDARLDAFVLPAETGEATVDAESDPDDVFAATYIDVAGVRTKVYPIGSGSWCWSMEENI
jgi:hypothetical protein